MKIISYCLYGDWPNYHQGLIENLAIANKFYLGWRVRVYVPTNYSYPLPEGVEVVRTAEPNLMAARFLAANDGDMISRDLDSRLSKKDYENSEKWLASGADSMQYGVNIQGGMIGLRRQVVTDLPQTVTWGHDNDFVVRYIKDPHIFEHEINLSTKYSANVSRTMTDLTAMDAARQLLASNFLVVANTQLDTSLLPFKWKGLLTGKFPVERTSRYSRIRGLGTIETFVITRPGARLLLEQPETFYKDQSFFTPEVAMPRTEQSIITKFASFGEAVINGTYVSDSIREEREATCKLCEHLKNGHCGICGCGIGGKSIITKIANLAAYEENLPKWGCKHPQRKDGKGWLR